MPSSNIYLKLTTASRGRRSPARFPQMPPCTEQEQRPRGSLVSGWMRGAPQLGGADSLPRLTHTVPQFPRQCSGHDNAEVPGGRRDLISGCKMRGIWLLPGTPQPAPLLVAKGREPLSPARLGGLSSSGRAPSRLCGLASDPCTAGGPDGTRRSPTSRWGHRSRRPALPRLPRLRPRGAPDRPAWAASTSAAEPAREAQPRASTGHARPIPGSPTSAHSSPATPRLPEPALRPAFFADTPPTAWARPASGPSCQGLGSVRSRLRSETLAPTYGENGSILLVLPDRSVSNLGVLRPRLSSVLSSFARLARAEQGRAYVRSSPHNSPGRKCHPHPFHSLLYMVPLCAALWVVGLAPSPP